MNKALENKLKTLPRNPGVYFHKDKSGEIIYVGKAAVLKNRVKQYFQSNRVIDAKTRALVSEISDIDWVETESEIDALFLEAEMVKRYMPKYNILLRDDKSSSFIRIDTKSEWPTVTFTRNPLDDEAEYFGPYYNNFAIKKALRYLRKVFPYFIKPPKNGHLDLDDHLGLSPAGMTSGEYKVMLRKLISYIEGNRKSITKELELNMKAAAKNHDFEKAASIRDKLNSLKELQGRIMFGDKEFLDISKDQALIDLTELLDLKKVPARIEGYDISHIGGTNVVSSMVVFANGVSDRKEYRKFKIRVDKNDDFYNMNETIARRLSEKNLKTWGVPDLILIDGGKGQLEAALKARNASNQTNIPFIGLAKADEQIVVRDMLVNENKLKSMNGYLEQTEKFMLVNLPKTSHVIKLLQRIRDESHRFAVSYHSSLRQKRQKSSALDDIVGIGSKTKSKLIRKFGSINGVKNATEAELRIAIGESKARLVMKHLQMLQ